MTFLYDKSNVHVATVSTDSVKVENLRLSCINNDINLIILGDGLRWTGFGMKLRLIRDWLYESGFPDTDIIIFTDAYDTVCQKNADELYSTITSLDIKDRLFCSAEVYLWPPEIFEYKKFFDKLISKKQNSGGDAYYDVDYKYPCAGQYLSTKKTMLAFIESVYTSDYMDDQEALIRYLVANPSLIYLDRTTQIFQPNLYLLINHDDAYFKARDPAKKYSDILNAHLYITKYRNSYILKNKRTHNSAFFLHANGTDFKRLSSMIADYITPVEEADTDNFKKSFPAIEVITLDQRRSYVSDVLKGYRLDNANIFNAVIGSTVSDQTKSQYFTPRALRKLSNGEIGCALSHINILEKYVNSSFPYIVVFEDDFSFANIFPSMWIGTVMEIYLNTLTLNSSDWTLFYLGRCEDICSILTFPFKTSLIVKSKKPYCTHAYVVNTKNIPKLLSSILPLSSPIDNAYISAAKKSIISYSANPPLFFQGGFTTSIEGRSHVPTGDDRVQKLCSDTKDNYVYFPRKLASAQQADRSYNIRIYILVFLVSFILLVSIYMLKLSRLFYIVPLSLVGGAAFGLYNRYTKPPNVEKYADLKYMRELTLNHKSIGFLYITYNTPSDNIKDCLSSIRSHYKNNPILIINDGGNSTFLQSIGTEFSCMYIDDTENLGLKTSRQGCDAIYRKWSQRMIKALDKIGTDVVIRIEDDVRCIRTLKHIDLIDVIGAGNVRNAYNSSLSNKRTNTPKRDMWYNCGGCRIYNTSAWRKVNQRLIDNPSNILDEYNIQLSDLPKDGMVHDDWFDGLVIILYGLSKKQDFQIYNIEDSKSRTCPDWNNKSEWDKQICFVHNYKKLVGTITYNQ